MDSRTTSFNILMFPWLAHGHIFPYLELSRRILKRKNFHIYFCSTAINLPSIKNFIDKNMLEKSIELVEIHLKPSQELPPHYHTTKNLPSHLNFTLIKAFQTADSSFSNIISNLKPDLLIYDVFQPWSAKQALSQGIPAVHFVPFGAATFSVLHYHYKFKDPSFPFSPLCLPDQDMKTMDRLTKFLSAHVFDGDKDSFFVNHKLSSDIILLKTSKGFEGKYVEYYSNVSHKKVVPVGPLVKQENTSEEGDLEVLKWLSKKDQLSTVYISFGSEYFLNKEEIEVIAKGLEMSEVNFIWVIRFPIEEKITLKEALPQGFLERVKERGVVVETWVPQAKILAHPNTAAFVSHCGWSSVNESIYYAVPMIAMPFKLNMLIDARLVDVEGVGVMVKRDESNLYTGEELAKTIKQVVFDESGHELRHKVRQVSDEMKRVEEEELDEAAEQLWQLCLKKKERV
ncbi:UDP-glucuronosyl and UDP-glucosyl transferase [Handroanthus impetiginosus]|uniref:UDP-glucuronosyl and UDP-glucosyl transferase n=1 Tax=Handroanthus impetiginosus TaxID=429701 RepID=A0A2G9GG32_9LAMI|nr:UDP-glucuronosyl and UDP-glucosyl transferase [Handroanthus impetiginosus]